MLNKDLIQKLKQTNISKDSEKTKERVRAVWKAFKSERKKEILALAGITKAAVYRVFRLGAVSAKLVIPIAAAADVDPCYLTGASDESGKYSDELAVKLLTELGYSKILSGYEKKPRKPRGNKAQDSSGDLQKTTAAQATSENARPTEDTAQPSASFAVEEAGDKAPEPSEATADLTEDEMILLLKSLLLRARLDVSGAGETADKIRQLLLS